MAVRTTPEEFAEKHARRLKAALEDMRAGINRVTEAPGVKAANKKAKWVARLSEKAVQDKWAVNVGKVPLEAWKSAMIDKGLGRVSAGVDAAHAKVVDFATKLISHQNAGLANIQKMPDLTLEDSISRAAAWMRHMSTFKR